MTTLIEKAIRRVQQLSEADEAHWEATFATSQDTLAQMARQAREQIERGDAHDDDPATRPE